MNFNTNSFLARYYRWMFRGTLPNDFCTLFWNTLLSVIFLPMTCLVYPVDLLFRTDKWESSLAGKVVIGMIWWVLFFLLPAMGLAVLDEYLPSIGWKTWNIWLALAVGWLAILIFGLILVLIGAIIFGSFYGLSHLHSTIKEDRRLLRELQGEVDINGVSQPSKLRIILDTIRNKYCTKITWKN